MYSRNVQSHFFNSWKKIITVFKRHIWTNYLHWITFYLTHYSNNVYPCVWIYFIIYFGPVNQRFIQSRLSSIAVIHYLFPRSGIWAIQPLGPFLIIWFHLPVGRYLVKILSPDFSNDCSIGSWKCWLSLSLLLSLVFYSTHPQFFVRSYISWHLFYSSFYITSCCDP